MTEEKRMCGDSGGIMKNGLPCINSWALHTDGRCTNHSQAVEAEEARKLRKVPKRKRKEYVEMQDLDIIDAIESKKYLKSEFHDVNTWKAWIACLKATFALSDKMTDEDWEIFSKHTGRMTLPDQPFGEVFLIIGRRGGKSFVSALIAVYLAIFVDWSKDLRSGELGYIFVIASDLDQSRVVLSYIKALLSRAPFKEMVKKEIKSQVILQNNIVIEIKTASWRGIRGYTCVAAICDELGMWRAEYSANPSEEILEALRPTMDTVKESLLIGISTPKGRRGALWQAYKNYYGKNDDNTLVWHGTTLEMNPTFPKEKIDRAMKRDPHAARAEYYAEFRADEETYLPLEDIEAATIKGRKMLLFDPDVRYRAFVDSTGGRGDSFALAIGHLQENKILIDRMEEVKVVREMDLELTVTKFCVILKDYKCHQVVGDKFAGNWVSQSFERQGIIYKSSERTKNDLYMSFMPLVLTRTVELPDIERLSEQLQSLERIPQSSSTDSVNHPKGGHDDCANVIAGVAVLLYDDIKRRLTPEYMLSRLPIMAGRKYLGPASESYQQEQRVMDKLKEEEEII
jgi:hypothetical protein